MITENCISRNIFSIKIRDLFPKIHEQSVLTHDRLVLARFWNSFLRVELIKTRKVKVMSESLLHPYEPARTASHSRYQSTLWPSAVPQLCSGLPQAWVSRKLCSKRSGIFVGSSRIINENLSPYFSLLFFHTRLFSRDGDTSPMTMRSMIKLFILVVNLAP